MGKRIYRLSPSEVIQQKEYLIGKEINIVLNNSTVFLGKVKAMDASRVSCENARGKKFSFAFTEMKEVIYDQHSTY